MIQYASEVNQTMKGLAAVASNHSPLLALFAKNWPLIGVAGGALAVRYYRQWQSKTFSYWQAVQDAGIVISPLVGIFLLQKIAEEKQVERAIAKGAYATGIEHGGRVEQAQQPPQVPQSNTQEVPGPNVQVLGRLA